MSEETIELKAQLKLLETKFEVLSDLLEKEGLIRKSDIEEALK